MTWYLTINAPDFRLTPQDCNTYTKSMFKGVCSDPQLNSPSFPSKHMEILVPEVELYLDGFMCEAAYAKSAEFMRNQ